jgi:hypothetical protein
MGMRIFEFVLESASILFFVLTPLITVWGWIRWARREKRWTVLSVLSLVGFGLATGSTLLAIVLSIYGHAIGGFDYYDPRLMRIYALGLLLSATGLASAIAGVWRFNTIRWHALVCSLGTLVYWLALTEAE